MENQDKQNSLKQVIIDMLHTCYDPEIPVDIYDLGLIYNIDLKNEGDVTIEMTLTSPACPVAGSLPGEVEEKIKGIADVKSCKVELVWEPPWDQSKMTEAARLKLNMY